MYNDKLLSKTQEFPCIKDMFGINTPCVIAGPCAFENYEQADMIAQNLVRNRINLMRGGLFKPRTSQYNFQGLGHDGLEIINCIRKKYGLRIVTEILDVRDVEIGLTHSDVIQIGSRNMFNTPLLKEVGRTQHPVLLKRGMMATLTEFMFAVEYIINEGNKNIIMCERGVRTFENSVRNLIDISSIAIIKQETSLPVIVDLSHSLGNRKDILQPIAKAMVALGVDGLMVEVHNNPKEALSDSEQQLSLKEFDIFLSSTEKLLNIT